ncbi:SDR family oxidoreductase [Gordonia sp. HY285]|uniref:SDR family oxidoreductase n=1 Tax=Gordonia liuliyuniae TaxID=2911517 RepID=A0ABS9ITP1_9ACTN|nr:SDR family NAD(P)-dependent oxidoreductase [Gordonia liuliyuniae]MCF8588944.1 SDR family oxidoreductase [Gordonia liuliyuniae]MCF8609175.1 SDR family oxidoreductase [Gordonia liuliyuniae]
MSDRAAIVTGGASGIGAACAERLASDGFHVLIADLQEDAGRALADRLGGEFVRTDVTDEADVAAVVDRAGESLEVFFANAGVFGALGPIERTDMAAADHTIAVNLRGTVLCLKHAVRVMRPRGRGSIIVTASPGGIVGGVGPHIYSATKAGVAGLVRAVAAEARDYGIRVNSLVPGAIVSPMTAAVLADDPTDLDGATAAMAPIPLVGRPGQPSDVAGAVSFLASPDSAFVTGTELVADAGYTHASGSAAFAKGRFAES